LFTAHYVVIWTVQVQATEYLERKTRELQKLDLPYKGKWCLASTSFRNGINRQNMRKLYERQSLLQVNDELHEPHPNLWSSFKWSFHFLSMRCLNFSMYLHLSVKPWYIYSVFSLFTITIRKNKLFTLLNIWKVNSIWSQRLCDTTKKQAISHLHYFSPILISTILIYSSVAFFFFCCLGFHSLNLPL
jgi:hypothetical protein